MKLYLKFHRDTQPRLSFVWLRVLRLWYLSKFVDKILNTELKILRIPITCTGNMYTESLKLQVRNLPGSLAIMQGANIAL
jgi:hypothetical protein